MLQTEAEQGLRCSACKKLTELQHYRANGATVCPDCAEALRQQGKPAPAHALLKALLYGSVAAIVGTCMYTAMALVVGFRLSLVAVLIGWIVGKAVFKAASGGFPQQMMAVVLTYFSISAGYIPVAIYQFEKHHTVANAEGAVADPFTSLVALGPDAVLVIAAAPFLALAKGTSGIFSLVVIFVGLQRAWKMAEQPKMMITGPH
jgi:hypothetical protein